MSNGSSSSIIVVQDQGIANRSKDNSKNVLSLIKSMMCFRKHLVGSCKHSSVNQMAASLRLPKPSCRIFSFLY